LTVTPRIFPGGFAAAGRDVRLPAGVEGDDVVDRFARRTDRPARRDSHLLSDHWLDAAVFQYGKHIRGERLGGCDKAGGLAGGLIDHLAGSPIDAEHISPVDLSSDPGHTSRGSPRFMMMIIHLLSP
jgi:hypothetical protein